MVSVGSEFANTTTVSNTNGILRSKLKHSYPQRFEKAFAIELNAFASVLLDEDFVWPVTKNDILQVQTIACAAEQASRTKSIVEICRSTNKPKS